MNRLLPGLRAGVIANCVLALGLAVPACDNGPELAQTLELSAPTTRILVGQTAQITATVKGKSGKTLAGRQVLYQSSSPTVAIVNTDGAVLGLSPGAANIVGMADGVSQSISFVVSPVPVSRITMSRDTATLAAATTLQLAATALDSAGNTLFNRPIAWTTSDAALATVNGSGLVSALAPGSVTISATTEGKTGQTRITVTPAAVATIDVSPLTANVAEGSSVQFTAVARDLNGRLVTGRKLNWSSSDVTRATVDSTGLVRGIAPGVANILVTSGNVFGAAAVRVTAVNVGSITVTPDSQSVDVGQTVQLTAVVKDSAGRVIAKPVSWTSLNTSVAIVDGNGLVTTIHAGTASIVGLSQAKADTVTVFVRPTVSLITLTPSPATLGVGRSGNLLLTVFDADSVPVTGVAVTYASSNENVATVDPVSGSITGVAVGSATINATFGSHFGSAVVNVVATTVASVAANFSSVLLTPGATRQIVPTLQDAGANVLSNRLVVYSSSTPAVATVDASGLITAVGGGVATITITSEGVSATILVTVS